METIIKKEKVSTDKPVFHHLVLKKEKSLFIVLAIFSVLIWMALAVSVVGFIVLGLVAFFVWFGAGLMAAHLKSEAVQLTPHQMPELYQTFLQACVKLEIHPVPSLYVLQAGGALNAFAMRHARRDFVVVYADFIEAFSPYSKEIDFILGHELGHIRQNHLVKNLFLAPAWILPLLWPAYSRACESTCDVYGAYVSQDMDASIKAMLALSGGKQLCHRLDAERFANQRERNRGFFVSLHELTSGYPTFARRVANLIAERDGSKVAPVRRNLLAYFVGCFSIGTGPFRFLLASYVIIILVIALVIAPAANRWKALIAPPAETTSDSVQMEPIEPNAE